MSLSRQATWARGGIAAALVACLMLAILACTDDSATLGAEPVAATAGASAPSAEEAVRQAIESTGATYAGDCATTQSPRDLGKICSKLIDTRGSMRAYLTGRTFSEFSQWLFVEQTAGGWRTAGTAPLDFHTTSIEIPWP